MKAEHIRLNGMYRIKSDVYRTSVQADGMAFTSPDVTIVRSKSRPGRARLWYFDAKGNAFRSSDLEATDVIAVEL